MKGFLQCHKNTVSQRWCQNVKHARSVITYEVVSEYVQVPRDTMTDVKPEVIVYYDEWNLTDNSGVKKVIWRGMKCPVRISDTSKQSYSVMFSGTAAGCWLLQYIVYKAEHLYESWTTMGPKRIRYNWSKNGWFTAELFED